MKKTFLLVSLTCLSLGAAAAQGTLTLPGAVNRALQAGPDVTTARANLRQAEAELRAARADPSPLITSLTQAEQGLQMAQVNLSATKLNVAQEVITQYLGAYEASEGLRVSEARMGLDERQLQIARARLQAKTGTQLDVNRAETALNDSRQTVRDARAQEPILKSALLKTLGQGAGSVSLSVPSSPPRLSVPLTTLQSGLSQRSPLVVQAAQAVEMAQLQVKISDNDYTPARTLQDARTNLANAQRQLESAQRGAANQVRDAYRAAEDALSRVGIARQSLQNAQTALSQAETRLKAGTVAQVDVESARVQVQQARLGVSQAEGGVWRALAGLSVAAGRDVTGLVR
ncbi:TolC family protein [Deinococcus lacus]|uniref:TolC family protein n=1 Tax=Deinococcus lacus TaxID=392561 RepID=A0ABW1YC44_9DEIO